MLATCRGHGCILVPGFLILAQHMALGNQGLCAGPLQSPINIEPRFAEENVDKEVRVLYRPFELADVASVDTQDRILRVTFNGATSPGKIQLGKDYLDHDAYVLSALEVHAPSEHTFRRASWPMEIQLWHTPMTLTTVLDLADETAALESSTRVVDARLTAMDAVAERLKSETEGRYAPWELQQKSTDAVEELDWIDSNKEEIEAEAAKLQVATKQQFRKAVVLANDAERLIKAQRRPLSSHRVVVSLFLLRSQSAFLGTQNASTSQLAEWIIAAMGAFRGDNRSTAAALDLGRILDEASTEKKQVPFFAYEGSLTREPCTPDVQWFVAAEPFAASMRDLENLIDSIRIRERLQEARTWSPSREILGGTREIQPVGDNRKLQRVSVMTEPFAIPTWSAHNAEEPGVMKWFLVVRYCKVFFLCATFIFCAPVIFMAYRIFCRADDDEKEDLKETMLTPKRGRRETDPDQIATTNPPWAAELPNWASESSTANAGLQSEEEEVRRFSKVLCERLEDTVSNLRRADDDHLDDESTAQLRADEEPPAQLPAPDATEALVSAPPSPRTADPGVRKERTLSFAVADDQSLETNELLGSKASGEEEADQQPKEDKNEHVNASSLSQ